MSPVTAGPRRVLAALVLLVGALALGAFTAHAQPLEAGAVYTISNAASGNQVLAFHRSHDGSLTPAGAFDTGGLGTDASLGSQGALALSDNGRYLVAVNGGSDSISLFAVRPSGLQLLDTEPAQGDLPVSVTISGDVVYVLDAGSGNIAGFEMGYGQLVPIAGSIESLPAGAQPAQVSFTRQGRNLVVTIKNLNEIETFPVDRSGAAGPGSLFASAAPTPFGFALDKHDRAIVSEAPGSDLSSYQVAGDGNVTLLDGPVPDGQAAACWVALSKDGRFAFTANAGNATISSYAIDGEGNLTLVAAVAGNTAGNPLDLAVSNDGHFLYAISQAGHSITEFAIGDNGSLTALGSINGLAGVPSGLAAK